MSGYIKGLVQWCVRVHHRPHLIGCGYITSPLSLAPNRRRYSLILLSINRGTNKMQTKHMQKR